MGKKMRENVMHKDLTRPLEILSPSSRNFLLSHSLQIYGPPCLSSTFTRSNQHASTMLTASCSRDPWSSLNCPSCRRASFTFFASIEKPQSTVFVGKTAPTVENNFMLSLLRLCGPVKSWKSAQDPSDGIRRGFGCCEFESPEGILRALRPLTKFNVDGQELVATKEYLVRYVEMKTEREKLKKTETEGTNKEEESAPGPEKIEPPKSPSVEDSKEENVTVDKENQDSIRNFVIVTDGDQEADQDALEKLRNMLERGQRPNPCPLHPH